MEFDPEKLEQRKQRREELRKRREQDQQKLKKTLIIGGSILGGLSILFVAAVILLAVMLNNYFNKTDVPTGESTASTAETETVATEPDASKTVIHFVAAGDFNVTDKVVASGGTNMDYRRMISDVLPVMADADLMAMNFEGNFIGAPYGTKTASAPAQVLTALAEAGVDMLQVCNSYTVRNGLTGMRSTISTIRANGIEPIGAYATKSEAREKGGYTIWEVNGVRVAVVAFTKGVSYSGKNTQIPSDGTGCVNLLYKDYYTKYVNVDNDGILDILERVKKEKPDVTVAMLHWGSEYNDTHSTSQEKIRKLLLNNGVDAIIGSHPHYVQEVEFDSKKGTVVAYSLGDFVGDSSRDGTQYSIMLDLEITKDNKSGKTKITNCTNIPIYHYQDEDGMIRVLRIESAMQAYDADYLDAVNKEVYEAMQTAKNKIEARVK